MSTIKIFLCLSLVAAGESLYAAEFDLAARATNEFGIELHRQLATGDENLCLSPYSIQSALAMTVAGADGETRTEMARVLHFPTEGDAIHQSFAALRQSLDEMASRTAKVAEESKKHGGVNEPVTLLVANQLFAQTGYDFRNSFRELVQKFYGAPCEALDFQKDASEATHHINQWAADQTRDKIRDLIPPGSLNELTKLVLANAIYFKAPWTFKFSESLTKPKPFHIRGGATVDVPTMSNAKEFGYAKRNGFTTVALPYFGNELQFLILVPDEVNGLHALESKLTPDVLAQCAKLEQSDLDLSLPKFKFEPPTIALADKLKALGMKSAFDEPRGSANFDKIAPRRPTDYLYISQVFHKPFVAVDERGTEAAAATAVGMIHPGHAARKRRPIEVKVDHPFLYAIQHLPSGACLFIGRVTDPR